MRHLLALIVLLVPSLALATQFGGDATVKANNDNTNKARSTSHSNAKSNSRSSSRANNSQDLEITNEAQERDPVSSAYAPAVAPGACKNGLSTGAQNHAFGFSFGTTTADEYCEILLGATLLRSWGMEAASHMMLCQSPRFAKAFRDAGDDRCPVVEEEVSLIDSNSP